MKPGVWTPPPVMEAISEKVMPSGVMPAYSRQVMTTPIEHGSMPQMHSAAAGGHRILEQGSTA